MEHQEPNGTDDSNSSEGSSASMSENVTSSPGATNSPFASILSPLPASDPEEEAVKCESNDKNRISGSDVPVDSSDSDSKEEPEKHHKSRIVSSSSSDDDDKKGNDGRIESREEEGSVGKENENIKLDFDLMMEKKKRERSRPKKKKDLAIINDNDDAIAKLIADMRQAAREDRELNKLGLPATHKMAMFPEVRRSLGKIDLQLAFVEANILGILTDWLAPLPGTKTLPHVLIRTELLKYLRDLPVADDPARLKESGIGKAIMYLYRHPRETRYNKDLAGKIIYQWARPIFNLCADYSTLTKEDRQKRDEEMASKLALGKRKSLRNLDEGEASGSPAKALKPGDPGWICRARVPMPETREFITRPKWQTNEDLSVNMKREMNKVEKYKRKFADKKKFDKNQHAVKISIEGRKLNL